MAVNKYESIMSCYIDIDEIDLLALRIFYLDINKRCVTLPFLVLKYGYDIRWLENNIAGLLNDKKIQLLKDDATGKEFFTVYNNDEYSNKKALINKTIIVQKEMAFEGLNMIYGYWCDLCGENNIIPIITGEKLSALQSYVLNGHRDIQKVLAEYGLVEDDIPDFYPYGNLIKFADRLLLKQERKQCGLLKQDTPEETIAHFMKKYASGADESSCADEEIDSFLQGV